MIEIFTAIGEAIPTLGFPIICVVGLGWFIYKIYSDTTKQNADNMTAVQARCKEREDKLYQEIALNREINGKAIETLALYADRLGHIEGDMNVMKEDLLLIKEKINA